MINITDINSQDFGTFVEKFNNVVEHSPFVAGTLWKMKPFHSVDHFVLNTFKTIYSLPTISKYILICFNMDFTTNTFEIKNAIWHYLPKEAVQLIS